jgi:type IV pilus assembly protein PilY1
MRHRGPHFVTSFLTAGVLFLALFSSPVPSYAASMADYTNYPLFMAQNVPPNILFVVDFSDAMLPAAYGAYPLSYNSSGIGATYASNYNGKGLTVTDSTDVFDPSRTWFGMFDSRGCYSTSSSQFTSRIPKTLVTDACGSSQWDGNFLNWLAMRKIDQAKKVLIGGRTLSASNIDGSANTLLGEPKTGQHGSTNTCNSTSEACFRYVKFVPDLALVGRVPTTLPADTASFSAGSEAPGTISSTGMSVLGVGTSFTRQFRVGDTIQAGGLTRTVQGLTDDTHLTVSSSFAPNLSAGTRYYSPGRYFGSGEGNIYVNNSATVNPFCSSSCIYSIQVDLTSETTAYRAAQSTGLLQNLDTNNMRVGVMFTNSTNGVAATVFRPFDGNFNSSAITGIRNQALSAYAALAEGTYEALCYYRNSQGPCFRNSPADFSASVGASGDPFFFVSYNQMVQCCKSFILMVSSGIPSDDGNNTPNPAPFGNLFAGADTIGLSTTWLDNVAFYGQTHNVRNQPSGTAGYLQGTHNVTFYSVNAMGGAAGSAVLASAAKWGGFIDRNGNGVPESSGQSCTYPVGSTLGSGVSTSSPEWDVNQDCTPDTYFDASEGGQLEAQITLAISSILKRAASGTNVSVLANSSSGEGALYQAYFFPAQFEGLNEINWLGYVQGLFIDTFGNLREDFSAPGCTGPPDGRLILQDDCIIKLRYDVSTNTVKVDRYHDLNGDGVADTPAPFETVSLQDIQPIWEAGARLAYTTPGSKCSTDQAGVSCRRILTWTDTNNDKTVSAGEVFEFKTANQASLCPYLNGTNVTTCFSGGAGGAGQTEAANIIRFLRGEDGVSLGGLRDRTITWPNPDGGTAVANVWKLGDVVYSTPTVVGTPQERYDVIYGDQTYVPFYRQYKSRRQVAYVGANDGMLHAFNAGFYTAGDDPSTPGAIEHGFFMTAPPASIASTRATPKLGAELWAFIPQALLPHLQWFTRTDYTHVSYVDLKPKVTDARIFTPDADHPNGWGTILIAGMRFGGSCGACTSTNGAPPMTVTADFNADGNLTDPGDTRTFYSAYMVLDVTNPEKDPVLLWVFTDSSLGLSTSYPAVLRVSPTTDATTDNTNAKWFVVFGSGPTGYVGNSSQVAKFFVVDLQAGPTYNGSGVFTGAAFATGDANSFMGDAVTVDADLDFRVDVIYAGNTISNGAGPPSFIGKMYRITTASSTNTANWGITGAGGRVPSVLLSSFPYTTLQATTCATTSPCKVGPVTEAPSISIDMNSNFWIFWGTGRFWAPADKPNTDIQDLFGVKDCILSKTCTDQTVEHHNLLNVSSATVCIVCSSSQVTGVSGVTSFDSSGGGSLIGTVNSMDGWFTTLSASGERSLSKPTVLGGIVFFPSFIPSSDLCTPSGEGNLYALYYITGTASNNSVIGTTVVGSDTVVIRSIALGAGIPSQVALQIGTKGSGAEGSSSGSGSSGGVTAFIQSSSGVTEQLAINARSPWSRILSWRDL